MSILHILTGKVSRVNYLRKIVDEKVNGLDKITPIGTSVFVSTAIFELFNPQNNILIKHAKDISENDMLSLTGLLIAYYVIGRKYKDVESIIEILEYDFNYTREDFDMFKKSLSRFSEMSGEEKNTIKLHHPAVDLIISYGHVKQNSYIEKKIIAVLLYSHGLVKKTINEGLDEIYGK